MACLRLYGNPASRETTERVLAGYGANIEVENGTPDSDVLRRVLTQIRSGATVDARVVHAMDDPKKLAELIATRPDLLKDTIVVRGRSYMLGSDPSRLQSLMY